MVDYIKVLVKNINPKILEDNTALNFFDNINLTTGEIRTHNKHGKKVTPSKTAYFKNLEFKIYENGTITISGSVHKYFNNGKHNYNDFNSNDFKNIVLELSKKFMIPLENCILRSLEIGVNIQPPITSNEIIESCFLHKTSPLELKRDSIEGKYKQATHSQYYIKLYNKGLQYKKNHEILRFEIKYSKMEKLNKIGIYTLEDLYNTKLSIFKDQLLKEWNNLLFYDQTTQIDTLGYKHRIKLLKYSNPKYWSDLAKENPENYKYHKTQLKNITQKYSDNIHKKTRLLIAKKIEELTTNTTQYDTIIKQSKKGVYYKTCKVTGLPLFHEKEDALYIRTSTMKFLKINDPETYQLLCATYLPQSGRTPKYEKNKISQLAKQIRNTYYNPSRRNKFKLQHYHKKQYLINYGANN